MGSDATRYLREQLARDPGDDAGHVIETRRAFVGGTARRPATEDASEAREAAERALSTVRDAIWTRPEAETIRAIGDVDLDEFPDLARQAERCARAAAVRDDFDRLAAEKNVDAAMIALLRTFVLARPADRPALMEEGDRLLGHVAHAKNGARVVRLVRKRYPEIRALAPEWFSRLRTRRKDRKLAKRVSGNAFWILLGVLGLIRLFLWLIRTLLGGD